MATLHAARQRRWSVLTTLVSLSLAMALGCSTPGSQSSDARRDEASVIAAERERLRALVAADMTNAERLHAHDFNVVNPLGRSVSRAAYLASVASGESDYLSWEPQGFEVRVRGPMAAMRYRSQVDMAVRGQRLPTMQAWNTGIYERRNGEWAIVWFQVTEIARR